MLLDEPTAYLDLPRRVEVLYLLRTLARETGRAVLLSTHDLDLALRCADRVWLMDSEGKLANGAPEDLVLCGAFEAAFQAEGVRFDPASGSFAAPQDDGPRIVVHGDGLPLFWTRRALERAGYSPVEVVSANATSAVEVRQEPGGLRWHLRQQGKEKGFGSLFDLLQALKPVG